MKWLKLKACTLHENAYIKRMTYIQLACIRKFSFSICLRLKKKEKKKKKRERWRRNFSPRFRFVSGGTKRGERMGSFHVSDRTLPVVFQRQITSARNGRVGWGSPRRGAGSHHPSTNSPLRRTFPAPAPSAGTAAAPPQALLLRRRPPSTFLLVGPRADPVGCLW